MNEDAEKPGVVFDQGVLILSGDLKSSTVDIVENELSRYSRDDIRIIDGSGIRSIDTGGAVFINSIVREGVELQGFSESAKRLLDLSQTVEKTKLPPPKKHARMTLERLGGLALREIERINEIAILISDILYWGFLGLFNRSQYRKGSFSEQAFQMGSSALPIVGMILFLVGAISALQSTATFRSFGASIFVADMIAIGLAREMAPLMTAIIVSGRSGSAIASEIATMKFTEELDAIKTMGLNPVRFVVIPKLWAMVVCMPLLSIMALLFGLLGGFFVAITYIQLSPKTFIDRVILSLFFWDIVTGLIKSVSFAVIIPVVGTYRGLTFTGGADGVGRSTTSSVLSSIFAIIVMDSIWGIVFYFKF